MSSDDIEIKIRKMIILQEKWHDSRDARHNISCQLINEKMIKLDLIKYVFDNNKVIKMNFDKEDPVVQSDIFLDTYDAFLIEDVYCIHNKKTNKIFVVKYQCETGHMKFTIKSTYLRCLVYDNKYSLDIS